MDKKLWVVLLVLTFMLGSMSSFWSKPAQANTEEKRRECVCAAWPWHDGGWDKVTPPPNSDQNPANSSTNSTRFSSGDKPEAQKVRQKSERSLWSHFRLFLLNLRLLFGGK
jgi:hypothetical protein